MSWNGEDFTCGSCGKAFPAGWQARNNHCRATGHEPPAFECASCPRWFQSREACHQHMYAKNHFLYECRVCDETWPTDTGRIEHEQGFHHYCASCDRHCHSYNNIQMHLRSGIHTGHQIACPFCQRHFATATGMTHHLESSACPAAPSLNRDEIYQLVRSKDPHGAISKKLLGWHGSPQYEATERSWNGYAYQCYFCRREFKELQSLTMHLNSPTHQQALYHCPNRACSLDFKTLASVINHLESEACGFMRFEAVQQRMASVVISNRLLTF